MGTTHTETNTIQGQPKPAQRVTCGPHIAFMRCACVAHCGPHVNTAGATCSKAPHAGAGRCIIYTTNNYILYHGT